MLVIARMAARAALALREQKLAREGLKDVHLHTLEKLTEMHLDVPDSMNVGQMRLAASRLHMRRLVRAQHDLQLAMYVVENGLDVLFAHVSRFIEMQLHPGRFRLGTFRRYMRHMLAPLTENLDFIVSEQPRPFIVAVMRSLNRIVR